MAAAVRGLVAPAGTESATTCTTAMLHARGTGSLPDVGEPPRPAVWLRTR